MDLQFWTSWHQIIICTMLKKQHTDSLERTRND